MLFIGNRNLYKMKNQTIKTIKDQTKELIKTVFNKRKIIIPEIKSKLKSLNPSKLIRRGQDFVETKISQGDEEVVLSQSRLWARSITWSLMGGTAFGLGWLAIAQTEEIVVATGKLEPINGVVDVQMPLQGIAEEILIKEGELVEKGQLLIKLDSEISKARFKAINKNLEINQIILEKYKNLFEEGAVSELQYLQQQTKVTDMLKQKTESFVNLKYQNIVSPVSGLVFDLKPKSPGFVARSSEPVLKIVPTNNLKAQVEVKSKDIGFVSLNKQADISIDSFPATDFGVLEGTVTKIGSDALPPDPREGKGYRYPVEVTLKEQKLKIKSGKKLPLQVGMSLTANIKLRKVSYLQLLLGTFKDKTGSLKEI